MMTIKGFAALCQCTAQTLRYYDQVGLLKPARVDEWSGYRYYDETQAVDFVKIKNLQAADFTIGEIKALLTQPDQAVYDAFEQKIAAQREKLAQIIRIQQTYLREKISMEKIHQSMTDFILSQCGKPEILLEFGLQPEDSDHLLARLRPWMNARLAEASPNEDTMQLQINDEVIHGPEEIAQRISQLDSSNLNDTILLNDRPETRFDEMSFVPLWEKSGWAHVHEFLEEIPPMEKDQEYRFRFALTDPNLREDLSFAMFTLAVMLLRHGEDVNMAGCECLPSPDDQNHFTLLVRK